MKHAPTAIRLAAAAMALAACPMPLSAQTPQETQAPPSAAPPSAPQAAPAPAPDTNADPVVERQRNSAAKLAGLVTFVSYFCPEAKPDFNRFKAVVSRMGVDLKELEQGGSLVARVALYTEAYRKDTAESCKRAFENFGDAGTTIPGLIARKEPGKEPAQGSETKAPAASDPAAKDPPAKDPPAKDPAAKNP